MTWRPTPDPVAAPAPSPAVERVVEARPRDVAGFPVARLLPALGRPLVGPFVFFDHFGPRTVSPGGGMDVGPHPHVGLATVTYLFDGEILHRDSLGSVQSITPGAINWMTAGRGIVHSERTPAGWRAHGGTVHGLQLWVGLPAADEEMAPTFQHLPASALPGLEQGGVRLRVLAGSAFGATSPVQTRSPLFYVQARVPAGARVPIPTEHPERAIYVVEGAVTCGGAELGPRKLLVLARDAQPELRPEHGAQVVLLGGAPLDGPRHLAWNFVSSRPERLAQAKDDWRAGRFPPIPGDAGAPIPLPD